MNPVKRLAIVGGTHGNELPGVQLVKLFEASPELVKRDSFQTATLLANENAIKANKRYVDTDLNRLFSEESMAKILSTQTTNSEEQVVQVINNKLRSAFQNSASLPDYILDLHNTTSNTGIMLCFHEKDLVSLELGAYLQSIFPNVNLSFWAQKTREEAPFLPTLAKSGMTLEVGPISHSTFDFKTFDSTQHVILKALDYLHARNLTIISNQSSKSVEKAYIEQPTTVVRRIATVPFPRNPDGSIKAFVAPGVVGSNELNDSPAINENTDFFRDLSGNHLKLDFSSFGVSAESINQGLYAVFVNEASYYEKDVACYLVVKEVLNVKILDMKKTKPQYQINKL